MNPRMDADVIPKVDADVIVTALEGNVWLVELVGEHDLATNPHGD